jgi:hypothetical protein
MKPFSLCCVSALICSAAVASAQTITEATRTFSVNATIDDPADPPMLFTQVITDSAILSLTKVEVGLHLVGTPADNGFASDMFVSLNLDLSPTSVLLNRVGISGSNPVGFFYDGWNVTFADDASNGDVHTVDPGSGVLTGTYQPDGRTNPTDTARTSLLNVFNGRPGNGEWRLAIADLAPSGQMQLVSWSITLSGTVIPEPSAIALLTIGGLAFFVRRKR